MRIFHLATAADWAEAGERGSYRTSTRGRTLAEEGFIHASRGDQWQGVRDRFYADVDEPLVLLVIDTDLLSSPVVEETVPDSEETFPHIYGPLDVEAVVQVIALPAGSASVVAAAEPTEPTAPTGPTRPSEPFLTLYLREVYRRIGIAVVVMVVVAGAALIGVAANDTWGGAAGALLTVIVCAGVWQAYKHRAVG